ncbi:MAG: class I SAM-dependent methyltransferase [Anaerolineae bacterium]
MVLDRRILENEEESSRVYLDDVNRFGSIEEAIRPFNLITWNVGLEHIESILEVACGPGFLTFILAQQLPAAQVLGTDISPALIEYAQGKHGSLPNLTYAVRDGYALAENDATYDLVICNASLHHFARPAALIREMLRVTKPGGKVYIFDLTRDMPPEFFEQLRQWERAGNLTHSLLSASIQASLNRAEYRALLSELDLDDYDLFFFTNPGPFNIPLPVVGLTIAKDE